MIFTIAFVSGINSSPSSQLKLFQILGLMKPNNVMRRIMQKLSKSQFGKTQLKREWVIIREALDCSGRKWRMDTSFILFVPMLLLLPAKE